MKYIITAANIWLKGPRENQEDSIFPEHGKIADTDRLFILCDGMGGHSAGEVASKTVCKAISESVFKNCPDPESIFSDECFNKALHDAYDLLDTKDDGAEKKMGTTMTFLKFHAEGCTIAHIGDSRVYHLRPGKGIEDTEILFQTEDHSLVNDLIKIGELTPEEAKNSKQKNVITRAMQPCMERRPKADIHHIDDIKPGDYFMLCSDGILEQMEDDNIKYIFSERGGDIANKVNMLVQVTEHNHDNHSAIIILVSDVIETAASDSRDINEPQKLPDYLMAKVEDQDSEAAENSNANNGVDSTTKIGKDEGQTSQVTQLAPSENVGVMKKSRCDILGTIMLLLLLLLFGIWVYKGHLKKNESHIEQYTTPHNPNKHQSSNQHHSENNAEAQVNNEQQQPNANVSGNSGANSTNAEIDINSIIPTSSQDCIPSSDTDIINSFQDSF